MHKTSESKTTKSKIRATSQNRFTAILFAAILAAPPCLSPKLQAKGQPSSPPGVWQADLGNGNTADGSGALFSLTTGSFNTAIGFQALFEDTTGSLNTALGYFALVVNNSIGNTAAGYSALSANTTGSVNTAVGSNALLKNTTGSFNVALGEDAGIALTTGDHNIDIGNGGVAGEANTIRIGDPEFQQATYIAGISGTSATGTAVVVNSNGQLGVAPSSERFKTDIKPMDKASEAILALKPVTFHYKQEIDPKATSQFGLVAEEVAKVNPDLVARDRGGRPYTVRYEAVNAMLLNEFLKEHRKVEQMQKQIDALTAGLQKVSAQLEVGKAAPQTVLNNQ